MADQEGLLVLGFQEFVLHDDGTKDEFNNAKVFVENLMHQEFDILSSE